MALSTNRTLITQTGINTHQVLNVGGLDSAGIATFSNFKTGSSNLHSTGLTVGDTFLHSTGVNLGTGATVSNNGNATFSGIITASSFVGDISNATGAAAGLGTALSQTQTDPLNKIYYTDKVLSISTTQTIDHPATANLAYTQYGDIKIEDGHDLIIKDGDDFKYDILGISTTKLADNHFPNGLNGDLTGDVTGDVTGNINNSSNLLLKTDGVERIRIQSDGDVGIGTINNTNNERLRVQDDASTSTVCQVSIISGSAERSVLNFGDKEDPNIGRVSYHNNTNTISLFTNNTERLLIDSNGNVTKPTSFHIIVDRSSNQTGYNACNMSDVILWNRVISGQSSSGASNHFDTSTGLFTAPVTGLYLFHVAVNCNYAVQGAWLNINGSRPNYANFYPNGANSADAMITYKVTAGHTVGVKWYYNCQTNGTINSNPLHTWWRIILLG